MPADVFVEIRTSENAPLLSHTPPPPDPAATTFELEIARNPERLRLLQDIGEHPGPVFLFPCLALSAFGIIVGLVTFKAMSATHFSLPWVYAACGYWLLVITVSFVVQFRYAVRFSEWLM
jgi:hypothetical protein